MSRKNRDVLVSFDFLILLASSILFYLYIRGFALINSLKEKLAKLLKIDTNEEPSDDEKNSLKLLDNIITMICRLLPDNDTYQTLKSLFLSMDIDTINYEYSYFFNFYNIKNNDDKEIIKKFIKS